MTSYIIEQKVAAFANQYRIFSVVNGDKRELVAFAHQKRLAFKEKVDFFTDTDRTRLVFTVRAEKVMDVHGKFIITDAKGNRLGAVRKAFTSSLLRSTWEILDKSDETSTIVRESSEALALFRRIWSFIPFLGDIPFLLKYHFDFIDPKSGTLLAKYSKTTLLRDHYRLNIHEEALLESAGWQTLIAQVVLLDALQGR